MNFLIQDADDVNWDDYWSPNLTIDNALGDVREESWHAIAHNEQGEAWVYEKRRVKGAFLEYLELNQFPFDTQVNLNFNLPYSTVVLKFQFLLHVHVHVYSGFDGDCLVGEGRG